MMRWPAILIGSGMLWKERNGFEIVLFGIGLVITIGLFIFFVRMFHNEKEDPPAGGA